MDDSFESNATEWEFRIEGLKQKGFTKEQVIDVLDNLGLADNSNKRKLKADIETVYSD